MERELSFEYDDVGLGESDDEVGDDEQPRGTGKVVFEKGGQVKFAVNLKEQFDCVSTPLHDNVSLFFLVNAFNLENVNE